MVIAAPPAGGGGSKIIAILAIIALSVFTVGIATGLLATAGGLFAAGSVSADVMAGDRALAASPESDLVPLAEAVDTAVR